jgi:hypothetical protein
MSKRLRSWPSPGQPLVVVCLLSGLGALAGGGCKPQKAAEQRFFDTHIQPILTASCTMSTSPCHRIEPETGVAAGNLDLSSFEAVQKRRDVLRSYGAYPQPLLLLKAMPKEAVLIPYRGQLLPSDIVHLGGQMLQPGSEAFSELKRWLDAGATRDGLPGPPRQGVGYGPCTAEEPAGPLPTVDRQSAAYQRFVADVQPLLRGSCAFSTCHGSPQADFFISCGLTDGQRDANYLRTVGFIASGTMRVEESELLLRPLPPTAGGLDHTGGSFFTNRDDPSWKDLRAFAELARQSPVTAAPMGPGETFFNDRVMPVLIRKGCALETCHSPNGFNDFRLRPGAVGFLSPFALHRNYQGALHEFMAVDTVDVRQSRLVKKNLPVSAGGIDHRGGSLFDDAAGTACPPSFDPATASAVCTLAEWLRIERGEHADAVSPLAAGNLLPVALVARAPDPDGPLEFDTFRGGADLRLGSARLGAGGRVEEISGVASALGACAGLAGKPDLDIRGPEWSADGSQLVFAARQGEGGGLDLWLLEPGAGRCRELTADHGRLAGAVKVHNFDPVFAPDGSVVFASTRRGVLTGKRLLPNADLYRVAPDLDFGKVEAMTALGGSELGPAFMQNGQVTFTTEKASPDFYQLSGRRINWDLTDYHPLLAQRARSTDTFGKESLSIGYQQATEIREGLDRNFLVVLSDAGALGGGGALGIFNRSVGPFEEGRADLSFMRALRLPDPAATGRPGTRGVYRSPVSLPDGGILASFAANVSDPARDVPRYDLVVVDERTGARRMLLAGQSASLVEAAVGFKRSGRLLFRNTPQLVFGGVGRGSGDEQATVHFPDLPMLATLLDANLRRGRNVEALSAARFLAVYEAAAPTTATPDASTLMGPERVFTQRQLLGVAPLEVDGSVKVLLPSRRALVLELQDGNRRPLFTMREEHQVGPGEVISPGVPRKLFDGVCGGCHGSVSGREPDVAVTADALTGATMSLSRDSAPRQLR